jgi:hypothetical protein
MTWEKPATFEDAYRIAREAARFPGNHIRTCDGEDLLGVPHRDPLGQPICTADGKVVWAQRPRDGWRPLPDGSWERVPFLAHVLRITQTDRTDTVGLRVTPEVRVERLDTTTLLVRTLSIELTILTADQLLKPGIDKLAEVCAPLVRPWYPLHETVLRESLSSEVVIPHDGMPPHQPVLFRFRGRHEDPHRPLPMPGDPYMIG